MSSPVDSAAVTTGSPASGYPCPKDGTTLVTIRPEGFDRDLGAWCPECKTVWLQIDEVSLRDLDSGEVPGA